MNKVWILGLGLAAAIVIGDQSASAFQEQNGSQPAPAAAETAEPEGKPVELAPVEGKAAAAGTEVRIPGLGRLGVLPKMDFGLELLYGAAESKPRPADVPQDANEDLTIRGTVKHRF